MFKSYVLLEIRYLTTLFSDQGHQNLVYIQDLGSI